MAQEAEGSYCSLIKTPDRISERPPQLAVFLFAMQRMTRVALRAIRRDATFRSLSERSGH
jgi:hypothetical protein